MSDLEDYKSLDSDASSDNEEQYSKLLNSVSQLDSTQRVKPATRKEISAQVSEYNLQKGSCDKKLVNINELARVLRKKPKHISITHKLKRVTEKSKTLPKPLEARVEERLRRIVGYESAQKQLKRWEAIVTRNAVKDHISFPLVDNSMKLQTSKEFLGNFKTLTPLEAEINEMVKNNNNSEKVIENDDFPLTLEEMLAKRKEMAQMRAKLSYKQAKAFRQNKIKSKNYHRVLKKEKLKQQIKEFEMLQKTDPEKALEKLSELDKNRALERASLRHRNTGQWAKNMTIRAKYDVESRKALAEQLKMSKELANKVQAEESSSEEESNLPKENFGNFTTENTNISKDNPWTIEISKEMQDFVTDYKSYWSTNGNEISNTSESLSTVKQNDKATNEAKKGNNTSDSLNDQKNSSKIETSPMLTENELDKLKTNFEVKTLTAPSNFKQPRISNKNVNKNSLENKLDTSSNCKQNAIISIRPTSGVWVITSITDSLEKNSPIKTKSKTENIESLFNNLQERQLKKAAKTVKAIKSKLKKINKPVDLELKVSEQSNENKLSLCLRDNAVERPDLDSRLIEGNDEENILEENNLGSPNIKGKDDANPEIDPKNFIQLKPKKLMPQGLKENLECEDAIDDDDDDAPSKKLQRKLIEEAFGEDDVCAEFRELKKKEGNQGEIKISNALPGWGEWGGIGIIPSKRKRKIFTTVKLPARKDKNKKDMIINENVNPNIKNHMVNAIPHPFKSADAFESNIRAPVGREWVPETAHHKLIQKQIETKLGTIIEPMNEDEIVKLKQTPKSPYQGKNKQKFKS